MSLSLILLHAKVNAQSTDFECQRQADVYGVAIRTSDLMDSSCYSYFLSLAQGNQIATSLDRRLRVGGATNFIVIENLKNHPKFKQMGVGGPNSLLSNITALHLDEKNREVVVLQESKHEVLVFPLNQNGNIAPLRVFHSPYLIGAKSVSVKSEENEIHIVNPSQDAIFVFSRLADEAGKTHASSAKVLARLPLSVR